MHAQVISHHRHRKVRWSERPIGSHQSPRRLYRPDPQTLGRAAHFCFTRALDLDYFRAEYFRASLSAAYGGIVEGLKLTSI